MGQNRSHERPEGERPIPPGCGAGPGKGIEEPPRGGDALGAESVSADPKTATERRVMGQCDRWEAGDVAQDS